MPHPRSKRSNPTLDPQDRVEDVTSTGAYPSEPLAQQDSRKEILSQSWLVPLGMPSTAHRAAEQFGRLPMRGTEPFTTSKLQVKVLARSGHHVALVTRGQVRAIWRRHRRIWCWPVQSVLSLPTPSASWKVTLCRPYSLCEEKKCVDKLLDKRHRM